MRKIFYHSDLDGVAAAYIWGALFPLEGDTYIPINYGDIIDDTDGRYVFLDFTPPAKTTKAILEYGGHVTIIDHHGATNTAEYEELKKTTSRLTIYEKDVNVAGQKIAAAELVFNYLPCPEDSKATMEKVAYMASLWDTWRWTKELEEKQGLKRVIEAIGNLSKSMPITTFFDIFEDVVVRALCGDTKMLKILDKINKENVEAEIAKAIPTFTVVNDVAVSRFVNRYISQTLHKALETMPVAIAVSVTEMRSQDIFPVPDNQRYIVSLRGTGVYDLRKLSQHFGGGGHQNAAGFTYTADNHLDSGKTSAEKIIKSIMEVLGDYEIKYWKK